MSQKRIFRIATRKSALALWQANTVKQLLENLGLQVELNLVVTTGDKMQRGALADISLDDPNLPAHLKTGKGLFVKEVQEEILAGRADLAVHSMKDLPVETTAGLRVVAVLPRANPSDVMVFSPSLLASLKALLGNNPLQNSAIEVIAALRKLNWKNSAPVGTTSARRQSFLRHTFKELDLPLSVLRGNVDTRLGRVAADEFSFIMLARAGIDRLGLHNPTTMLTLPVTLSLPAPAQGIVAIECREDDNLLRAQLSTLNSFEASFAAAFERTTLWLTGGNCHTALAAHQNGNQLNSWATANSHYSEFTHTLNEIEQKKWQKISENSDHAEVFQSLLQSDIAEKIHTHLVETGYEKMMTLRAPKSAQ